MLHSVDTGRCPAYPMNTVQLAAARQSGSGLRSSSTSAYLLPPLSTKFRQRAFSHAGPSAWNALPTHIRDVPQSDTFRKLLKTHFLALLTFTNVSATFILHLWPLLCNGCTITINLIMMMMIIRMMKPGSGRGPSCGAQSAPPDGESANLMQSNADVPSPIEKDEETRPSALVRGVGERFVCLPPLKIVLQCCDTFGWVI